MLVGLDENFLLADYIETSINTSSNVLPISLLEQVSFYLRKNHDKNNINNTLKEVN
jgi:hypothetical protein